MANKPPDLGKKRNPKAPNTIQVWEAWPNENRDAHFLFKLFRDMAYPKGYGGPWARRSLLGLVRYAFETHQMTVSHSTICNWADDFAWHDRARAFDLYMDSAAAASVLDELSRVKRSQLRRLAKLAELGEAELDRHTKRAERLNANPRDVIPITRVPEVVDLLGMVTKTERLILGESTENVHQSGGTTNAVMDLTNATMDDLRQIEEMRRRFEKKKEGA